MDHLIALAERLQGCCLGRGLTVATAESCTGGLIAHVLTEVPGSSGYLRGGLVVYADEAKRSLLGIPGGVIDAHGAVSAQVAVAMAEAARIRLGSDLAVAVTGIAGPGGGTAAKPVGLTYLAIAGLGPSEVRRLTWTGGRSENKRLSAAAAIELLLARIEAQAGHGPGAGGADAGSPGNSAADAAGGDGTVDDPSAGGAPGPGPETER
jgi:PncC family amidohydrolase